MDARNIGIFAHVDAGKTTLSEQLLLRSGAIRAAGSVDSGTAHTDDLPVERRRGISVRASCVSLRWKGCEIRLIDTPGHADFSAEIERSLWALDGAVLVVSAVEGIQPRTELLFEALREQGLPLIFFINKADREGADPARVTAQLRARLSSRAAPPGDPAALTEAAAESDDDLLERWLSGLAVPEAELRDRARALSREGRLYPVLSGSALRGDGVPELLDAVLEYLPPPAEGGEGLCGVAFAAARDRLLGKGLWVRMFSGRLENRDRVPLPGRRDPLTGAETAAEGRVSQIRGVDGTDRGSLAAGEIGVVYGLGAMRVGHVLGDAALLPRKVRPGSLQAPLMTVRALPRDPAQLTALAEACRTLSEEDPLLRARFSRETGELDLEVMGVIQLEVLEETLRTRFGLEASFTQPAVIYRETIARAAEGFAEYTMPKPCWAILHFIVSPAPRGSGVRFHSEVPVRDILPRYQHQVEQAIPLALSQGRQGWQVTDVDIALVGGSHHQFHTHPLDFIVATPWGIQDALRRGGSVLLEPVLEMRLRVPRELSGRVMSDVTAMRGEVTEVRAGEEDAALTALVPAAEALDYPVRLARATGGRGSMSQRLHGYRECPPGLGAAAPRRGVDPLDTARYILAARSALEGGIFDE